MQLSKKQQEVVNCLKSGRYYISWSKWDSGYGICERSALMPDLYNILSRSMPLPISTFRALRRKKAIVCTSKEHIGKGFAKRGIRGTWKLSEGC